MATNTFAGPIDYVVFAFPSDALIGAGLKTMLDRVASGVIELLDIDAVRLGDDGQPVRVPLEDLQEPGGIDMSALSTVQSKLLDTEDLHDIATELDPAQFALVIIYEDRSLASAADAFARIGGIEIFTGAVDIADLHAAIEGENEK